MWNSVLISKPIAPIPAYWTFNILTKVHIWNCFAMFWRATDPPKYIILNTFISLWVPVSCANGINIPKQLSIKIVCVKLQKIMNSLLFDCHAHNLQSLSKYFNHRLYSRAFEPSMVKFLICFVRTFGSKLYLSVEHNAVKYRRNKISILIILIISFSQIIVK